MSKMPGHRQLQHKQKLSDLTRCVHHHQLQLHLWRQQ